MSALASHQRPFAARAAHIAFQSSRMAGSDFQRFLICLDRFVATLLVVQPVGEIEVKAGIAGFERDGLAARALRLLMHAHLAKGDTGKIERIGVIGAKP